MMARRRPADFARSLLVTGTTSSFEDLSVNDVRQFYTAVASDPKKLPYSRPHCSRHAGSARSSRLRTDLAPSPGRKTSPTELDDDEGGGRGGARPRRDRRAHRSGSKRD